MPTIQANCLLQALLCFAIAIPSVAQPLRPDTALSPAATRTALFYQSYIGADAAIYNGYAYQPHYEGVKGSPYFLSDNLTAGTVLYEDITYTHVLLLYNAVLDQAILADPHSQLICLPVNKVRQFTIGDHTLIYLTAAGIPPGYYELLRSGYATLFVRHLKKIEERIESNELFRYITPYENYYLYIHSQYHPFTSEDGLLTLLADKKQQLKQYQPTQPVQFKKDPEGASENIVDYYNQLPH